MEEGREDSGIEERSFAARNAAQDDVFFWGGAVWERMPSRRAGDGSSDEGWLGVAKPRVEFRELFWSLPGNLGRGSGFQIISTQLTLVEGIGE